MSGEYNITHAILCHAGTHTVLYCSLKSSVVVLPVRSTAFLGELETKVHPKVRKHGEGLLLVESGYYRFHI